jgi:nitrite reductase/ring-hydroxylating ferredoxin subunit
MSSGEFPVSQGLDRIAVLERQIGASLERVWENVLDWEHLPWLHRKDFASIDLIDAGAWGWRAMTEIRTQPGTPFTVELLVERECSRYVTRTLEGTSLASEIWTGLTSAGPERTDIQVEFWTPGVPESLRDRIGAGYLDLYGRLWSEDETMMRERSERLREVPAADQVGLKYLELGSFAELSARLPTCIDLGGVRWRLVLLGEEIVAHDARCPHALGPLSDESNHPERLECPWHGYQFDIRTGRSTDGRRLRLRTPPRIVRSEQTDVVTAELV